MNQATACRAHPCDHQARQKPEHASARCSRYPTQACSTLVRRDVRVLLHNRPQPPCRLCRVPQYNRAFRPEPKPPFPHARPLPRIHLYLSLIHNHTHSPELWLRQVQDAVKASGCVVSSPAWGAVRTPLTSPNVCWSLRPTVSLPRITARAPGRTAVTHSHIWRAHRGVEASPSLHPGPPRPASTTPLPLHLVLRIPVYRLLLSRSLSHRPCRSTGLLLRLAARGERLLGGVVSLPR